MFFYFLKWNNHSYLLWVFWHVTIRLSWLVIAILFGRPYYMYHKSVGIICRILT